jgi:hypothetical protein
MSGRDGFAAKVSRGSCHKPDPMIGTASDFIRSTTRNSVLIERYWPCVFAHIVCTGAMNTIGGVDVAVKRMVMTIRLAKRWSSP